jgi:hypothetical protein
MMGIRASGLSGGFGPSVVSNQRSHIVDRMIISQHEQMKKIMVDKLMQAQQKGAGANPNQSPGKGKTGRSSIQNQKTFDGSDEQDSIERKNDDQLEGKTPQEG